MFKHFSSGKEFKDQNLSLWRNIYMHRFALIGSLAPCPRYAQASLISENETVYLWRKDFFKSGRRRCICRCRFFKSLHRSYKSASQLLSVIISLLSKQRFYLQFGCAVQYLEKNRSGSLNYEKASANISHSSHQHRLVS